MLKIDKILKRLESLVSEWYYCQHGMTDKQYFDLCKRIDGIFQYIREELKTSKTVQSRMDKILSIAYVYDVSQIEVPKEYLQ